MPRVQSSAILVLCAMPSAIRTCSSSGGQGVGICLKSSQYSRLRSFTIPREYLSTSALYSLGVKQSIEVPHFSSLQWLRNNICRADQPMDWSDPNRSLPHTHHVVGDIPLDRALVHPAI